VLTEAITEDLGKFKAFYCADMTKQSRRFSSREARLRLEIYLEIGEKMKKLAAATASVAIVLGLSGCSLIGQNAEPYGGQCALIGQPVFDSSLAMTGLGTANFSVDDALQEFVWGNGYTNIGEWITYVESVGDYVRLVDTSGLSSEEAQNIEYLTAAFAPGEMMKAAVVSDTEWYTNTYDALISIGVACDGRW
jgi:hypothetical protein